MQQSIIASPLSRQNIRDFAFSLRRDFNLENDFKFPIVPFLEWILPETVKDFALIISDERTMGNLHGLAKLDENAIYVREDVYLRAIDGEGRDRFTLAHELGHFFLHHPERIGHARIPDGGKIKAYHSPEWQANAFAGELLVPANLIKGMSPHVIARKCGVSVRAAEVQVEILNR
jgi:Zn-dependent peptidase ImmA (M78 family)